MVFPVKSSVREAIRTSIRVMLPVALIAFVVSACGVGLPRFGSEPHLEFVGRCLQDKGFEGIDRIEVSNESFSFRTIPESVPTQDLTECFERAVAEGVVRAPRRPGTSVYIAGAVLVAIAVVSVPLLSSRHRSARSILGSGE